MTSNAKFCAQCGHELPDPNPPFCSQCGSTVSVESNSSPITDEAPITPDTPISAILAGFKNYINFSGKATRYELFWFVVVCGWLIPSALNMLTAYMEDGAMYKTGGLYWALYLMFFQFVTLAYFVGITVPLFAVFVRRLHSVEKDTKWVLTLAPYWALAFFSGLIGLSFHRSDDISLFFLLSSICLFPLLTYCLLTRSVQDSIKLKLLAFGLSFVPAFIGAVLFAILFSEIPGLKWINANVPAFFGFILFWYIYKRKFE